MAAQVEVELGRVCDGAVHRGARWDIATLPNLQEVINTVTAAQQQSKGTRHDIVA